MLIDPLSLNDLPEFKPPGPVTVTVKLNIDLPSSLCSEEESKAAEQ